MPWSLNDGRKRKADLEQALISIAREAYANPREAAVRLLSLGVPMNATWLGFVVVILVSVVVGGLGDMVAPPELGFSISYFMMTMLLAIIFLSFATGVWKAGQAFGGKGSFEESLLIGVFFQAVLLPFQILQLLLVIALPGLAGIYAIGLLIYGIWINAMFVDALHGFASFGRSLLVLFLGSLVAAVALMITIALFGRTLAGIA